MKATLIGGSAGSLPAFQEFFESLPARCGISFFVIQHLSQNHSSKLAPLLYSWSALSVDWAKDGERVRSDHVHVAPPGHFMTVKDGIIGLDVQGPEPFRHRPIDFFCQTFAGEFAADGTLVILSGTGSDGTMGSGLIRQAGGKVFAQEPESAQFGGMPLNLIRAGSADFRMRPAEIAQSIHSWGNVGSFSIGNGEPDHPADEVFGNIIDLVRMHAGMDMSGYKPNTLRRRIERRMGLMHAHGYREYLQLLRQDRTELSRLAEDLLIGVTSFFRDAEAFRIVEQEVVPEICSRKTENEFARAWVAGCSTGEEAYSIAILLMEWFESKGMAPRVQVFATDVDDSALKVAREGVYEKEVLENVPQGMIQKYFEEGSNGFRVRKAVREKIVFASHNLISDPPFSRLDLVVCRNLLIYLNNSIQKKLLSLFHFVLNSGGYLFLGSSESIGSVGRHFHPVSKQWRIFRHIDIASRHPPVLPITANPGARRVSSIGEYSMDPGAMMNQVRIYRQLLEKHGPAQILVNSRNEILYVSGDASPYLGIPVGQASHDLFRMVREDYSLAARSAVSAALRDHVRNAVSLASVEAGGQGIRIEAAPVSTGDGQELLLISFCPEAANTSTLPGSGENDWAMKQLLLELNAIREDHLRTIEESRVSGEEMRAANEEIMAMNEELQSANEELESSKEELQSLNEELTTANSSLDAKVVEVEKLNSDLNNLITSTRTATLLLDEELRIRRFTPACSGLIRLIPGDIGRAIDDVVRLFEDATLAEECSAVLSGAQVPDREVRNADGRWFLRRLLPYRESDGHVDGVVVTFPEITSIKDADRLLLERARKLEWHANLLSRAAPVLAMDQEERIIFWNRGAEKLYGWTEEEALGKLPRELLKTRFPISLEKIRSELMAESFWKGELVHVHKNGREIVVESQWTLARAESGESHAIVEVTVDITERKEALQALKESEILFHTMADWTYNWEYWLDPEGKILYMTPSAERVTGYRVEEIESEPALLEKILLQEDRHLHCAQGGEIVEREMRILKKGGAVCWVSETCRPVFSSEGKFLGRRVTVRDITDQKEAEERIRNLAYFDPLTQLPNRRLFLDRLGQALMNSRRSQRYGALLMLDLDHFKSLNETRGHAAGDTLLLEVGQRIASRLRAEDTVARAGGDEFLVLLEGLGSTEHTAAKQAEEIAEKLRSALESSYGIPEDPSYYITSSVGLALFRGQDSAEVLLKQADLALYQAKNAGRNRVRFFNPEMQAAIEMRTTLEASLRRGLENGEFRLYYQPQVDENGRVLGAEALIRWISPDRGLVSPSIFIPVAEECGLIARISQWVLDAACRQLKLWESDASSASLVLAVNVSARWFHHQDFVGQVRETLASTGANPARLKLELTESVVLDNFEDAVEKMRQLIEFGLHFSMDDFGTGYSSLSYLKRLPLDQVKIDQSFVRDVTHDPGDAAIVRAILTMNESLGLQVIAEGVETLEQFEFLRSHGCRLFQGYLFGKPVPIGEWSSCGRSIFGDANGE